MMYHIRGIFLGLLIIVLAILAYRDRNHFDRERTLISKKVEEALGTAETEKAGGRK